MHVYIIYENDFGMSNFQAPTVHSVYSCAKKAQNELRKLKESDEYEYSLHFQEVIA